MTPKMTKAMAAEAEESGADVRQIKRPTRPEPKPTPIPAPAADLTSLTGAMGELVQALKDQLKVAQDQLEQAGTQNETLRAMAKAALQGEPVRLKPIRDMDPKSPTYLLMEYLDVIPVTFNPRKLDS